MGSYYYRDWKVPWQVVWSCWGIGCVVQSKLSSKALELGMLIESHSQCEVKGLRIWMKILKTKRPESLEFWCPKAEGCPSSRIDRHQFAYSVFTVLRSPADWMVLPMPRMGHPHSVPWLTHQEISFQTLPEAVMLYQFSGGLNPVKLTFPLTIT
jgi:hypothetical protein